MYRFATKNKRKAKDKRDRIALTVPVVESRWLKVTKTLMCLLTIMDVFVSRKSCSKQEQKKKKKKISPHLEGTIYPTRTLFFGLRINSKLLGLKLQYLPLIKVCISYVVLNTTSYILKS